MGDHGFGEACPTGNHMTEPQVRIKTGETCYYETLMGDHTSLCKINSKWCIGHSECKNFDNGEEE